MKKSVMEEYCKNARNMTERMKRKYGARGICLSQTQFRGGQLKRFQQNVAMHLTISYI